MGLGGSKNVDGLRGVGGGMSTSRARAGYGSRSVTGGKKLRTALKNTKIKNSVLDKGTKRNQTVIAKGGKNVLVKKTKTANVLKKGKK